jgi:DNA-binding NarL/FixJ family response regulator
MTEPTTKKAILCVDDEQIVLTSLKTQIKEHFGDRYMYEMAESADEAWEVIEELDGKGDEFLIQVHKKFPGVVKVMLTGQATEEAIHRVIHEAHLARCLHKPWTEQELIETIREGLEGSE